MGRVTLLLSVLLAVAMAWLDSQGTNGRKVSTRGVDEYPESWQPLLEFLAPDDDDFDVACSVGDILMYDTGSNAWSCAPDNWLPFDGEETPGIYSGETQGIKITGTGEDTRIELWNDHNEMWALLEEYK